KCGIGWLTTIAKRIGMLAISDPGQEFGIPAGHDYVEAADPGYKAGDVIPLAKSFQLPVPFLVEFNTMRGNLSNRVSEGSEHIEDITKEGAIKYPSLVVFELQNV